MTRPVPHYKDLCLIFRETNVNGRESLSSHELYQQDAVPDGNLQSLQSPAVSFSSDRLTGEESSHLADQTHKHQLENPSSSTHSKKLRTKDEGVASAIREMATAVSSLADKRKDEDDSVPIECVIEAIQALPDMDDELVLDACDFLEDEKKAKTFLALDIKLRKKWLIRKLRPQEQ